MIEETKKIRLQFAKEGIKVPDDVDLSEYGFDDGEKFVLDIDEETGEGKLMHM